MEQRGCDYCGLPLPGPAPREEPAYCCYGCRFARSVTGAEGDEGRSRWMMTRLGLALFFTMNVMVFTMLLWSQPEGEASAPAAALYGLARHACLLFTAPVLVLLGGPLLEDALAELRLRRASLSLLLLVGVAAAFAVSAWATWRNAGHVYYEVACMVLVAVTLGRWLEASGKLRTTEALRDLRRLLPDRVRRRRDGTEQEIELAAVVPGDVLRVLPGEHVPTDGRIAAGRAALDESAVTGESEPVVKGPGAAVHSGTCNLDGELLVEVTAPPGGGTLERLIDAVTAAASGSRPQRLAERISGLFLPLVLVVALATFAVHWRTGGLSRGVLAGLAVVVVSCPCALGLATPLALWAALGAATRRHVLIRDGDAFTAMAGADTVCFDKTGTLTTGCRVTGITTADDVSEEDVLALAAALAGTSTHVHAVAITAAAAAASVQPAVIEAARFQPGRGIEAVLPIPSGTAVEGTSSVATRLHLVGLGAAFGKLENLPPQGEEGVAPGLEGRVSTSRRRPRHVRQEAETCREVENLPPQGDARSMSDGIAVLPGDRARVRLGSSRWIGGREDPAAPTTLLAIGDAVIGGFRFEEEVRPSVPAALAALRSRGLVAWMLSGDRADRAAAVAAPLGLRWRAPLLPEEKTAAIAGFQRDGSRLVMVGDGVNDAAALAAADTGVALGCGADVSRWSADICLLRDDLGDLPWLVDLARRTRATIRWNLLWAFGYNAACIPLAASGVVHPAVAAAAMVASSVLVVTNSLRLGQDGTAAAQPVPDAAHATPPQEAAA